MIKNTNILFFLCFIAFGLSACDYRVSEPKKFQPYLENSRHLQIPQWEHEDWYVEDWASQKPAMEIIQGFYEADILKDQIHGSDEFPVLIVGPNFYHLSGYDKRRVVTLVDSVYGISGNAKKGSFFLRDWYTHQTIGVFDQEGLHLH